MADKQASASGSKDGQKTACKTVTPSGRAGELAKLFTGRNGTVQLQPGGWTYLPAFEKYQKDYSNFEFWDEDVVVLTMPKSGTTWTQEMVWTMRNNPNLDNPDGNKPLNERTPNLEVDMNIDHVERNSSFSKMFDANFPDFDQSYGMFLFLLSQSPRPRTIKTHLSFSVLPPVMLEKTKVVYTIRDPRDVCLSYFHHCRIFKYDNFTGSLEEFVEAFMEGVVLLGPYWSHVNEAWALRKHPNMHIMFYEKMKKNTMQELEKLNKFLGTNLNEAQLKNVMHYSSFEEMKKRDNHVLTGDDTANFMDSAMMQNEGGFFRQGTSGGWRKVLSQAQQDKFEAWISQHCADQEIMKNILHP